jgi:uncharacterized protein (DUF2062 family)
MELHDVVLLALIGSVLVLQVARWIAEKVAERQQQAENHEAELHLAKVTGQHS